MPNVCANLSWPVLNIMCTCMISEAITYLNAMWLQNLHYGSSDMQPPPPTAGSPSPSVCQQNLYQFGRELYYCNMVKFLYLC